MKGLIFTYLLTFGGSIASLINPYYGLLTYVCFAIIKPESMWYWSVPEGPYSRIVALSMLVGWSLHGFGNWQLGRSRGIVYSFVGFWLWSVASTVVSQEPTVTYEFVESLAKVVLPFLVGITVIDSVEKLKQLAWVIMLSQGYVGLEMNLSYYGGFNRAQELGFAGLDNNSLSIAMVAGVGLALFLGLGAEKMWHKMVALGAAMLMAHTIMFSFSRGGMLALVITGVLGFILLPKQPKHYWMFLGLVLVGVRLAGKEVLERFGTSFAGQESRDTSAQSRLDLWRDCFDVMVNHPLFGVGPDQWPFVAPQYGWSLGKEAHSLWFQTGAELGFVGVLLLLIFYGTCVRRLWGLAREKGANKNDTMDPWLRDVARMVVASVLGFVIAAQFVTVEGLEIPYYVVLIGAGALKLLSPPTPVREGVPSAHRSPSWPLAVRRT